MSERVRIADDWFPADLPTNIQVDETAYLDSAYAFDAFASRRSPGLVMGRGSGAYDRAAFVVGAGGFVEIGDFSCLNGTYVVCDRHVEIGDHCLLSWGVVICDSYSPERVSLQQRRKQMDKGSANPCRPFPGAGEPLPVRIEDNVWIGFDAFVAPGVTVGRGSIVACKTIVRENVPAYSLVAGNPQRVVRRLDPGDEEGTRQRILAELEQRESAR